MAKPHKSAGRAIQITSSLPPERLADLCQQAAEESETTIRLEDTKPEKLLFSVRGRMIGERTKYMTFEVRITSEDKGQVITSRILSYRTSQQKLLFLIPMGPSHMPALSSYEKFVGHLRALALDADPQANIVERP